MAEAHPLATIAGTLPSGRAFVLRELTGRDELNAAAELAGLDDVQARLVGQWALVKRSVAELDGKPFDQSEVPTAEGFRNLFSRRDLTLLVDAFEKLNGIDEETLLTFRSGLVLRG